MEFAELRQGIVDEEQLKWLSIFYWVHGGVIAMYAPIALIYVIFGIVITMVPSSGASAPPAAFGFMFAGIAGVVFVVMAGMALLTILTGFWLRRRRNRIVCLVVGALSCLSIPYGTMLGVFTFIVLARPSVAALFGPRGVAEQ